MSELLTLRLTIDTPFSKIKGELYQITRAELMAKIEVKSHHGVQRAFVYVKLDKELPTDQQPIKEWTNNTNSKIKIMKKALDSIIKSSS